MELHQPHVWVRCHPKQMQTREEVKMNHGSLCCLDRNGKSRHLSLWWIRQVTLFPIGHHKQYIVFRPGGKGFFHYFFIFTSSLLLVCPMFWNFFFLYSLLICLVIFVYGPGCIPHHVTSHFSLLLLERSIVTVASKFCRTLEISNTPFARRVHSTRTKQFFHEESCSRTKRECEYVLNCWCCANWILPFSTDNLADCSSQFTEQSSYSLLVKNPTSLRCPWVLVGSAAHAWCYTLLAGWYQCIPDICRYTQLPWMSTI